MEQKILLNGKNLIDCVGKPMQLTSPCSLVIEDLFSLSESDLDAAIAILTMFKCKIPMLILPTEDILKRRPESSATELSPDSPMHVRV